MVVPFTEPPVATLGLPFIFFFVRSMNGSSHDPNWGAVDVNVLAAAARHGIFAAWKGCRGVAGDTLSPFRALISVDGPCRFIFVDAQVSQPEVPLDGRLVACAVPAFLMSKSGKC